MHVVLFWAFVLHLAYLLISCIPKVNIIYTHSHNPLHCLQLQRVFVAVQHLLQVIMSEGGKYWKLVHSLVVCFCFFLSRQEQAKYYDYWGHKHEMQACLQFPFNTQNLSKSASMTQKLFSLKSETSLQNMETFETAAHIKEGNWKVAQSLKNMLTSQRN